MLKENWNCLLPEGLNILKNSAKVIWQSSISKVVFQLEKEDGKA